MIFWLICLNSWDFFGLGVGCDYMYSVVGY